MDPKDSVWEFWLRDGANSVRLVTSVIAATEEEARYKALRQADMVCNRPDENPHDRCQAVRRAMCIKRERRHYTPNETSTRR